jgi:tRNA pseudouridine32 synthase/23S rRNA pseudouridine746 synthase
MDIGQYRLGFASYMPPSDSALCIVHVDDALIVLNKPSGLLSVPGRGADKADNLASRVQAQFADALIVHRLDMATSGLLIMARGALMQSALSRMFMQRQVRKRYVAVVAGLVTPGAGEIDLPLIADWPNRPLQKVDHEHGKPSLTRYRVLQHKNVQNTTSLELEPITGRSHQLRVHLRELGHPILGDLLYAPPDVQARASRLLLHASELALTHPQTRVAMHWHCAADFLV